MPSPSSPDPEKNHLSPQTTTATTKDSLQQCHSHLEHHHEPSHSRAYSSSLIATSYRPSLSLTAAERARRHLNAKLANPLADLSFGELRKMGRAYAQEHGLADPEDVRALEIGACLARDPADLAAAKGLGVTEEEMGVLEDEVARRWGQPRLLYLVIVICSACAAVQGMDETVVSGSVFPFVGVWSWAWGRVVV